MTTYPPTDTPPAGEEPAVADPGHDDQPTGTDAEGLVSLARADRRPAVDHELTLRPGASPQALADLLGDVPADACFVEHFGDVDLTVVFREVAPPASPDAARPTTTTKLS